jgi:microcystin-dependent protein
MSSPFLAEIRMFGFGFAPKGWAFCNGQLMPLSQNTALFALLGTQYGGDGRSTFALPNLQGSSPMNQGQGSGLSQRFVGENGGETAVTLLTTEMPAHNHNGVLGCYNGAADVDTPGPTTTWSQTGGGRLGPNLFTATSANNVNMGGGALALTGGGLPHNNMPPYLTVNFCIALQGIFPQRP